ncbi:MAG: type II secretion system protein [Planctomycetota bacterium]
MSRPRLRMVRRSRLQRRGGRGFTLVELAIYLALVTVGLATFASIEEAARRGVALQGALIDVQRTGQDYLSSFRADVEGASVAQVASDALFVQRQDGSKVRYDGAGRREWDARGAELPAGPAALVASAHFERAGREVRLELQVRCQFGWREAIERTYRRTATPRCAPARVEDAK